MVREILRKLDGNEGEASGFLGSILNTCIERFHNEDDRIRLERILNHLRDHVKELSTTSQRFFSSVEQVVRSQSDSPSFQPRWRMRSGEELFDKIDEETSSFETALERVMDDVEEFVRVFSRGDDTVPLLTSDMLQEIEWVGERAQEILDLVKLFQRKVYGEDAVWCEVREKRSGSEVNLRDVPLNLSAVLSESLYPRLNRCLFTSATLTIGGSFDYIIGRWGVDRIENERLHSEIFGSPFDFPNQVRLLIPAFLPSPKSQDFTDEVANLLKRLFSVHARGTMVLFTSHAMLRTVYRSLQHDSNQNGLHLLGQGLDGSREVLLKHFQENKHSVLLGTNSFWEGVDVPGSSMEMLIITKMPFDVPTEPLIEARTERAQTITGNGFLNYAVPEAIVKLRQGFGRLIRSGEDRGVVLLLDHRIVQTQYGNLFLRSLPVEAEVCEDESDLMQAVGDWFS